VSALSERALTVQRTVVATPERPNGFIGETPDALVGRSVAQSTARELLGRIEGAVEDAARADEKVHTRENVS
jgi:hypothetical protein